MKLVLLAPGRLSSAWARAGCEEFASRIGKLSGFEVIEVKDGSTTDECSRMLSRLKEGDLLVACDERGKEMTSEGLARFLQSHATGRGRLVFAVGGAWGLTDEFRARAEFLLSLSEMTLPHELARLVVTEQLYRALTILRGMSYHH